jgi:hypothetical protein
MAPIPPEQFTRLFRGLGTEQRVSFVAELWAGRGWEAIVDGKTVVATRGDETERVLVVDPGRFRTPALDGVDVLVAARDRDAVRAAAEAAGVRYLSPTDVREVLLYGLPREDATALFEQTFGHPLDSPTETSPSVRDRLSAAAAAAEQTVSERTDSRLIAVLLLAGLLVVGAATGPALVPNGDSAAVAPVGTFTPGEAGAVGESTATAPPETVETGTNGRPPGVGERALTDYRMLADAHAEAIVGNSRTLRVKASGPPAAPSLQGTTSWNYTARIESPRHYRFEGRYYFPAENGSGDDLVVVNRYADGETKFRQYRTDNETTYQRYAIETTGDASGYATDMREHLLLFLAGDRSTVECAGTLTGGDCFAYRIVVTGNPPVLPAEAADYRAVAIVQDNGVVSSLEVRYTLPNETGEREPVVFRFSYDDIGKTTVTPPDWLPEAKNETSQ